MNHNYFEQLRDQDWEGLTKRLILITCRLGRVSGYEVIGNGMTAEDIAAEAIRKTWNEDRRWDAEKCPDLFVHLAGAAKSIIWNLRKKNEPAIVSDWNGQDDENAHGLDQFESAEDEPLDGLIERMDDAALRKGIKKALAGVPSGERIYDLLASGRSPRDIAASLNLSVIDLYNLNRSIKRRLSAYASEVGLVPNGFRSGDER